MRVTHKRAHAHIENSTPTLEARPISKEYNAGIFSKLSFQWLFPLLRLGHNQLLQLEQLWSVTPGRRVEQRKEQFQKAYKLRSTHSYGLPFALYDVLKQDFWIAAICQFISGCTQVLTPFVLKYVIIEIQLAYSARVNGTQPPSSGKGIGLVVGLFLMQTLQSICTGHYYYRAMLLGGQARSILIACIFEKSMKLSNRARTDNKQTGGWNDGSINNLMANHTSRIDNGAVSFHPCWMAPLQVAIALILLCINLGYSALVGFAVICALSPVFTKAVKSLFARRVAVNSITEERVRLTQETLSSIKTVKIFAWEPKLLERLSSIRVREVAVVAGLLRMKNAILVSTVTLPLLASMLTFITYYFANHVLDPAPIFSSLALFNVLTVPLQTVALSVGRVVDANASAKLLATFFNAEEHKDDTIWDDKQAEAIVLKNASFAWEKADSVQSKQIHSRASQLKQDAVIEMRPITPVVAAGGVEATQQDSHTTATDLNTPSTQEDGASAFCLQDLGLSVERKELIVVIGPIGSGKSSLIAALSGDMRMTSGKLVFGSSKAVCAQSPWIQNTSIKENILFGSVLDEERYQSVINACALGPDLELLPFGDDTEIGERGVTLSGGQKQRINIARAIYAKKDIVLLDDPLSAVDAHVGRHILDQAICGLLKGKCCILVTHRHYVLPRADRIICMKDGKIARVGTYDQLCMDPAFANIATSSLGKHDNDKKSSEPVSSELALKEETHVANTTAVSSKVELMQVEERQKGSVSLDIYREFITASGSICNLGLVLTTIAVTKAADVTTSLWLSWWISRRYDLGVGSYIGIYVALCVWQAICGLVYCNIITDLCTRSGKALVDQAMSRTIGAPMSFFDTTPLGRITNRFSKDVDTIDNRLADNLRFLVWIIGTMIAALALVTSFYYYFAAAVVPLAIVFLYATSYYRPAAREIKRHEAVLRSAVFARFLEGVIGATTLRAYGAENRFATSIVRALDDMNGAYFLTFAGQRWLSIRLDALGNVLVLVVGILTITTRSDLTPSIAGLVLAYMLGIVQMFQELVHTYADTQNDMNSVERLVYYAREIEQEDKPGPKQTVTREWPQYGAVTFSSIQMRYRPGLPLVLDGLDLSVRGGERVGIVGRTGAGKSSILTALLRLCELDSGKILIDDIDTATLSLHDLRSRVSIIPQDPTLFNGTVRSNLDPFDEHTDLQLLEALRAVGLLDRRGSAGELSLETAIADGGSNLSHGQRQLLALARLYSTGSKIILCDEATSSIDAETDVLVQRTMLNVFAGRALLCIAHRLSTVIGYDRILVMDAGKVRELGEPLILYDQGGSFRGMCDRSGISRDAIVRAREDIMTSGHRASAA